MLPSRALLLALMFAACGGDDAPLAADAAPRDGVPVDVPDTCDPATIYFAGEVLAWGATTANPAGIAGATLSQRGDATKTTGTTDQGTFELCIANDPVATIDVAAPAGSDIVSGFALVDKGVIAGGGAFSIRSFSQAFGVTEYGFDATKAHVFVHVNNAPRTVGLAARFERSYAFDGAAWIGGEDTGQDLYFANVDPTGGETKIMLERAVGVPPNLPLEVGKLTFLVVNALD